MRDARKLSPLNEIASFYEAIEMIILVSSLSTDTWSSCVMKGIIILNGFYYPPFKRKWILASGFD